MPSYGEVAVHNSKASCWVVISGHVYDVTDVIDNHPGGADAILRLAGKDGTEEYEAFHAPMTLENNPALAQNLGPVTGAPLDRSNPTKEDVKTTNVSKSSWPMPPEYFLPLAACKSLSDFERMSRISLSPRAAAYFDSGAETLSALHRNRTDWARVGFRPRVLRNVATISMGCDIMGAKSSMPVFISPAAAVRLGHEDGELCLARGAARMAIPQCVCTYSSVPPNDVMKCFQNEPRRRGGALFFQLYVPKNKADVEKLINQAKEIGFEALIITVDSPVIGKRDDDDRFKALQSQASDFDGSTSIIDPQLPGEEAETLRGVHCSTLEWADLPWIRKLWGSKPMILKGIQTVDDAIEATRYDVDGIFLSNHGGRQLDYAPSPVEVLIEMRRDHPSIFDKTDVYVDGGIMRGTDVIKALCLGARAVGVGRGFLYALSAYGTDGVLKAIEILSDEIQTTMRLLGVTKLNQLNTSYLNMLDIQNVGLRGLGHARM